MGKLDLGKLRGLCLEAAQSVAFPFKPIDSKVQTDLASRYFDLAVKKYELYFPREEERPGLFLSLVRYLVDVHADPGKENNPEWFDTGLEVLLELVCPNTDPSAEANTYLDALYERFQHGKS